MVGWHHRLDGHKFGQSLGDSDGQGSLFCAIHGMAESDMTERLNWTELSRLIRFLLIHFHKTESAYLCSKCLFYNCNVC